MGKRKNLQPWLDYFRLLQTYEKGGYLEMAPDKHEAYVTWPAACTLALDRDVSHAPVGEVLAGMPKVLRRIRAYAGWLSQQGADYLKKPFALNVVEESEPHDLVCTLLISTRRRWWRLWLPHDSIDCISYQDGGHGEDR